MTDFQYNFRDVLNDPFLALNKEETELLKNDADDLLKFFDDRGFEYLCSVEDFMYSGMMGLILTQKEGCNIIIIYRYEDAPEWGVYFGRISQKDLKISTSGNNLRTLLRDVVDVYKHLGIPFTQNTPPDIYTQSIKENFDRILDAINDEQSYRAINYPMAAYRE